MPTGAAPAPQKGTEPKHQLVVRQWKSDFGYIYCVDIGDWCAHGHELSTIDTFIADATSVGCANLRAI